jgi:hypothetical protein
MMMEIVKSYEVWCSCDFLLLLEEMKSKAGKSLHYDGCRLRG